LKKGLRPVARPATLETGEKIRVDIVEGKYLERAKG
jgi:hypothetical protein